MSRPSCSSHCQIGRESGFTLIELISVLVLIGILAVVVFPKMASTQSFQTRLFTDQLMSAVHQARLLALSRQGQQITLKVQRQDHWQFRISADTDHDGQADLTLSEDNLGDKPSTLIIDNNEKQRLGEGDSLQLRFDHLGNVVLVNQQPLDRNLFFLAADKPLCISTAGLAWIVPDLGACRRG